MSPTVSELIELRHKIRRRRQRQITVAEDDFSTVRVVRKRRLVRITITNKPGGFTGKPSKASFAFADLDDAKIDRLIQRLLAIRGGKKALP